MKTRKYNKLIRDKIPEICLKNGATPEVRTAKDNKEYLVYLQKKIMEESREIAKESNVNKLKEEVADLVEVTNCLIRALRASKKEIEKIRKEKNKTKGGFKKRLILIKTKEQ